MVADVKVAAIEWNQHCVSGTKASDRIGANYRSANPDVKADSQADSGNGGKKLGIPGWKRKNGIEVVMDPWKTIIRWKP